MSFTIPETPLSQFSIAGLEELAARAREAYAALKDSVTAQTVTRAQLDTLNALREFAVTAVPHELAAREELAAMFAALDANNVTEVKTGGDSEGGGGEEPGAPAGDAVTASTRIHVGEIVERAPAAVVTRTASTYSSLVAAADVPGYAQGHVFSSMLEVAKAFEARSTGHSRNGSGASEAVYPVAQMVRDYPHDMRVFGDQSDYATLLRVSDERRLPGGSLLASGDSLTAAAGWAAPSTTDYATCLQISVDGMWDGPEVQAPRGGVRHNTGIEFDTIFGSGTGFFNLTEAQVASGTTKTCLEIPTPDFTDTRLGVTGLCLTGNILSIRGYPEFTETFVRGAMAASAHQVNMGKIAAIAAGSTAVDLSGAAPWATDLTVMSQFMSALEMAIVDIKYRMRLQRDATLEVLVPYWLKAQLRADWIRRQHASEPGGVFFSDADIERAAAMRGARIQWVYDWQDAFSTSAATGSPGADTPISNLPTELDFIVYPAGTWVAAVRDVITLNSVYDSTKLATNQVTHLFTEDGWAMLRMCPVSRIYTIPICPNGASATARAITCPS